jgi:dipeptidase E
MKKLFLASVFSLVGDSITEIIPRPTGLRVAFISTAAEVYEDTPWLEADRHKLLDLGFVVADYDIMGKSESVIYAELEQFDVVFVSGGNTFYLLYHAKQSGFANAIQRLIEEGKPYIGSSAGSIFVGPTIEPIGTLDDPTVVPELASSLSIGMVDFVPLPHYGKAKYADRHEAIQATYVDTYNLVPLTDNQAILVEGDKRRVIEVGD